MAEIWLDIPGYVGSYQASSLGRVRSLDRVNARGRRISGQIMSQSTDREGYMRTMLARNGSRASVKVHTLVLTAFRGARPDGLVCRHLNDDKSDNSIENLIWGTVKENAEDCIRNGTHYAVRKEACPRGHTLSGNNLSPSADGRRRCRACSNVRALCRYYKRPFTKAEADKKYLEIMSL